MRQTLAWPELPVRRDFGVLEKTLLFGHQQGHRVLVNLGVDPWRSEAQTRIRKENFSWRERTTTFGKDCKRLFWVVKVS